MPVQRLNHAVLYVRDVEPQRRLLPRRPRLPRQVTEMPGRAAFLQAEGSTQRPRPGPVRHRRRRGPTPAAGRSTVGLYHLAWEVDTLDELARIARRLTDAGALVGASDHGTTKALYAKDPDGIEFEVSWLVPADLMDDEARTMRTAPLDLDAEIARYGGSTPGGIGVSVPARR